MIYEYKVIEDDWFSMQIIMTEDRDGKIIIVSDERFDEINEFDYFVDANECFDRIEL